MRYILTYFCFVLISSCSDNSSPETADRKATSDTTTEKILGERINGPANVRDTVNGRIRFSLNDNVLIETGETKSNWLQIGVFLNLTPQQLKDYKILPKTDLLSTEGKIIGRAIDTVDVGMSHDSYGQIFGYTHKDNIKVNTIPENCLADIINSGKLSRSELQLFMTNFSFVKYDGEQLLQLTQFMIYESTVVDPSPRDRITLLFKADKLVGLIHSRPMKTVKYKTYELVRGHKLTITADLPQSEIKHIIDKRIEFLNSVD